MITIKNGSEVREVSSEEGIALLEKVAQKELGISAADFIAAWHAGKFDDEPDRPEVMRVAMLLPLTQAQ